MDQSSGEQQALLLYLEFSTKSALRWKLLQSQKRLSSPEDEKKKCLVYDFCKKKNLNEKKKTNKQRTPAVT